VGRGRRDRLFTVRRPVVPSFPSTKARGSDSQMKLTQAASLGAMVRPAGIWAASVCDPVVHLWRIEEREGLRRFARNLGQCDRSCAGRRRGWTTMAPLAVVKSDAARWR